jgi:hypothetical protein
MARNKENATNWLRQNYLFTGGKKIRLKWKRKHPDNCELCKDDCRNKKLFYHHWNYLEIGIWVCWRCHHFVEGVDRGLRKEDYDRLVMNAVKEWEKFNGKNKIS